LTAAIGFGLSVGLLHLGVVNMGLRYPVAALGAYASFLGMVRVWAEVEKRKFLANQGPLVDAGSSKTSGNGALDFVDMPDFFDGEGFLIALIFCLIIGIVVSVVVFIAAAPELIAEVFIDAVLTGLLYRHLRVAAVEHWLSTAVRKTWLYALFAVVVLAGVGIALDIAAPASNSAGSAIKELRHGAQLEEN